MNTPTIITKRKELLTGRLLDRTLLTSSLATSSVYQLTISLDKNTQPWNPGDSIVLSVKNSENEVDEFLSLSSLKGYEQITLNRDGPQMSVAQYLRYHADIRKLTSRFTELLQIHLPEDVACRKKIFQEKTPLQILREHPCYTPLSTYHLSTALSPLLPRFYSIASSPLENRQKLDIAVSTNTKSTLPGVSTQFLCEEAVPGEADLQYYIHKSPQVVFPSKSLNAPIIFIAAGTGIAPFRAFMQNYLHEEWTSSVMLFFGNRHYNHDFLYSDFWKELSQKHPLEVFTAFSRDLSEQKYVQDILKKYSKQVFDLVMQGAYIYICGSRIIASPVQDTLHQMLTNFGNLSSPEAFSFLSSLRAQGRLVKEVY